MALPLSEQIDAAKRELGMRQRVYPRFVEQGRMRQAKADYEIGAMADIIRTLEQLYGAAEQQVLTLCERDG